MTLHGKRPQERQSKEKADLEAQLTGENKKRLNAEVEAILYKRIKARAVEDGESVSEITRRLWIEYLSK